MQVLLLEVLLFHQVEVELVLLVVMLLSRDAILIQVQVEQE